MNDSSVGLDQPQADGCPREEKRIKWERRQQEKHKTKATRQTRKKKTKKKQRDKGARKQKRRDHSPPGSQNFLMKFLLVRLVGEIPIRRPSCHRKAVKIHGDYPVQSDRTSVKMYSSNHEDRRN